MIRIIELLFPVLLCLFCTISNGEGIITGAEQPVKYMPLLAGKRVGLVVNNSSLAGKIHLVDFLLSKDVDVVRIFAPEHGFRGEAGAGEKIVDGVDKKSGIPIVSIYGDNCKPRPKDLADLDIMVFDIQDVGCRFYTYISTLYFVIEACAENGKMLVVLDRPNPNGDYIAGPLLEPGYKSFVGMLPVPVVHGCTIGELARMINSEHWHQAPAKCKLIIIPVRNYSHTMSYPLPVNPSPNLPNTLAVRLYPSLCFFEATSISVGRGTRFPFQVVGGINPELGDFKFVPNSIPGMAVNPLHEGKVCYGIDLRKIGSPPEFTLKYFIDFYNSFDNKKDFLTRERWFNLLAGNAKLINKIRKDYTWEEINESWEADLNKYKEMRKSYLLYPDFE